jgi:CBS domain-containing protein
MRDIMRTVRHIIEGKSREVWSVSPETTVLDALTLMAEKNIGALTVLEGDALVGIFSERDYARKVILKGKSSRDLRVREIMTSSVVSAGPDQSVGEVMKIMTDGHFRHVPVVDGGKLAGIISIGDVVKEIIADQRSTIDQLSGYITGKI